MAMTSDQANDGGAVLAWLDSHVWEPTGVLVDVIPWWLLVGSLGLCVVLAVLSSDGWDTWRKEWRKRNASR